MSLAIVTGRGPLLLTDIEGREPYIKDEHVVHIAQRDAAETHQYGSQDIRDTAITCFDMSYIENQGIESTTANVVTHMRSLPVDGFWIHFDTDALYDAINPAVEYRLPGGLQFEEAAYLVSRILATHTIDGMSVSIFNPGWMPMGK
jgi:Arginase/agmatinase/formimionoglutamate hydrolase, arginase family